MANREIRSYDPALEESVPARVAAFHRCFAPASRLETVDDDIRWFRLRYWDYTARFRKLAPYNRYLENFHLDFLDALALNARTACQDGVYLIALHVGTLRNLQAFFTMALSHPRVLAHVGNAAEETPWLASMKRCRWMNPLGMVLAATETHSLPPPIYPIDRTRRLYAHRLAILATDFVFFHELGHLANGHLEFLSATYGIRMVDESAATLSATHVALDYQALEFNADSHALQWMLGEFLRLPATLPPSATFATRTEAIESLLLAMATLFLMLDQQKSTIADYAGECHPHPAVRMMNVGLMALHHGERHSPTALRDVAVGWERGLELAEEMFRTLEMGSAVWDAIRYEVAQIGEGYDHVARRFREIDPQLRPDLKR